MKRLLSVALVGALICLGAGCSAGLSNVKVKVTLDGAPVENATVTLVGDASTGNTDSVSGITDKDGIAVLSTNGKEGAKKGKYRVSVTKIPPMAGMDPNNMSPTDMMRGAVSGTNKDKERRPGAGAGQNMAMADKNELPKIYANPEGSGLTAEIPPPNNPIELKLVSSAGK